MTRTFWLDLGWLVGAEHGPVLLVGSESPNTVDSHVKLGAERFCRDFPEEIARIEVHRPDDVNVCANRRADGELSLDFEHRGARLRDAPGCREWSVLAELGAAHVPLAGIDRGV